jgi:hypothetical protein
MKKYGKEKINSYKDYEDAKNTMRKNDRLRNANLMALEIQQRAKLKIYKQQETQRQEELISLRNKYRALRETLYKKDGTFGLLLMDSNTTIPPPPFL